MSAKVLGTAFDHQLFLRCAVTPGKSPIVIDILNLESLEESLRTDFSEIPTAPDNTNRTSSIDRLILLRTLMCETGNLLRGTSENYIACIYDIDEFNPCVTP
ncbi:hypothetical protein GWI33_004829 [Rhynchophorus ferrugineus]|uniref:Uncharacterized protein n=1 Tax=Rhynchophorus ferrugineus TaxID=354439 RepID=A0A834IIC5_RHYFE|nr:hypothetical protein GWI33_004829 [Rhynchophorus ferrugineus]